jgi:predicted PurR-regulated permease PerM
VALVAAVSLLVYAVVHVQLVFTAVFVGLVLTSVLRPLTDAFTRFLPRPFAIALAFLSALVVVGALVTYVVASVAGQWQNLGDEFTNGIEQILGWLADGPLQLDVSRDAIDNALQTGREWLTANAADVAGQTAETVGRVAEAFAVIALAIFCTVFFLLSGGAMWRWFLTQVPQAHRDRWDDAATAGWDTFSGYARGTVLIALTNGLLAGIFLAILGIPLAAPLAVLVFIGTFIPLVGAPVAMLIAGVVALAADGPFKALIVILGVALIGQIEGHLLQPLIMGRQVALHPVVVAIAIAVGTVLAGILGAVVAVPVVAVTWAVYSRLRPHELEPAQLAGPLPEDEPTPEDA